MGRKILVVEDEEHSRDILRLQLHRMGYRVIAADSGARGLAQALNEAPNLILMDLRMPGINGIQATAWLKESPETSHIPIVAYTAWEGVDGIKRALEAGAARVLTKPVAPELLHCVIQECLAANS